MSTPDVRPEQGTFRTPQFLKKRARQASSEGPATKHPRDQKQRDGAGDATIDGTEERSIGAILQAARQRQGMELEQLADVLRLSPDVVRNVESDAYDQLGAPIYVRSYISRFAETVGLPGPALVERYRQLGLATEPPLIVSHSRSTQPAVGDTRWVVLPLLAIGVIWLGWLGLEQVTPYLSSIGIGTNTVATEDSGSLLLPGQQTAELGSADTATLSTLTGTPVTATNQTERGTVTAPLKNLNALLASSQANSQRQPANDGLVDPAAPTTAANDTVVVNQGVAQVDLSASSSAGMATEPLPAGVTATTDGSTQIIQSAGVAEELAVVVGATDSGPLSGNIVSAAATTSATTSPAADASRQSVTAAASHTLQLSTSEDCWADIKDADGQTLLFGTVEANGSRSLAGKAPFTVILGNSTAVNIVFNGKTVDSTVFQREGGVSKFTLSPPASG